MDNEQLVAAIKRCGYTTKDEKDLRYVLFEENLSLIKKFVDPYISSRNNEEDLMQEAFLGLIAAIDNYDESREVRFMTFARWYIVDAVRKYVKSMSCFYVPSNYYAKVSQYQNAKAELFRKKGHDASDDEIAEYSGLSRKEINIVKRILLGAASLDALIGENGKDSLGDMIPNNVCIESEVLDKVAAEQASRTVWQIVEERTNAKQYNIVTMYYKAGLTLPQIAAQTGLSVERTRQIKNDGMRRLRMSKKLHQLADDMEILDSGAYRCGMSKFRDKGSTVEYIAIRKAELGEQVGNILNACGE